MESILSQFLTILASGGLLLWFGKMLLEKSIQQKLKDEGDKLSLVRHSDLDFKRAQVQYLYGPLYGIMKTNRKIYDLWMIGGLKEVNLKVKQLFKDNNEKANNLIIANAHLIDENPMPDIFIKFATSSRVWSMYCADTEEGALPEHLSRHPDIEWCQEFEDYVFDKYEILSKDLAGLYKRYGIK
jgi:hypothetical protein